MSKWEEVSVETVSNNIQYGYTGKSVDSGEVYYLRITDIQNQKVDWQSVPYSDIEEGIDKYLLEKGDILFARTGATVGKSYLFTDDEPSIFASYLIRVQPDESVIPEYLYYYFQSDSYWNQIKGHEVGAAQPNVNGTKLAQIRFPLPSLKEQRNIVSKLDYSFERIDNAIALLEENIQSVEELMGSILDEEFITIEDSKRYQLLEHADLNRESIKPEAGKIYNYIGLENIESGSGKLVDYSPTEGENISSTKVKFDKEDVLYSKLRPYLNKVVKVDFDGVATTEILPIKTNKETLIPEYLTFYFRSPSFLAEVNRNTSGARMPRATTKFFKKEVFIPVPAKEKQKKSVEKLKRALNNLYQLDQHYMVKLEYLKSLKSSLLDQAFKGELV